MPLRLRIPSFLPFSSNKRSRSSSPSSASPSPFFTNPFTPEERSSTDSSTPEPSSLGKESLSSNPRGRSSSPPHELRLSRQRSRSASPTLKRPPKRAPPLTDLVKPAPSKNILQLGPPERNRQAPPVQYRQAPPRPRWDSMEREFVSPCTSPTRGRVGPPTMPYRSMLDVHSGPQWRSPAYSSRFPSRPNDLDPWTGTSKEGGRRGEILTKKLAKKKMEDRLCKRDNQYRRQEVRELVSSAVYEMQQRAQGYAPGSVERCRLDQQIQEKKEDVEAKYYAQNYLRCFEYQRLQLEAEAESADELLDSPRAGKLECRQCKQVLAFKARQGLTFQPVCPDHKHSRLNARVTPRSKMFWDFISAQGKTDEKKYKGKGRVRYKRDFRVNGQFGNNEGTAGWRNGQLFSLDPITGEQEMLLAKAPWAFQEKNEEETVEF
ncbi:MAG: hypothetical protein M1814_001466 [Vezdaea aestivalis]|nr:MAG: hypothetical protein M1814_001466 [Vezdaea aestivalis]